ncbi:MAG: hypothetical protein PF518_09645 [Spirochaetaceae bacterium]|nr:hypothetical protein [Spirochaetaceae bacterium]
MIRRVVHYNVTKNPNIRFLRSQYSYFEELYPNSYLINDNTWELKYFTYQEYEIRGVATTPYSPNLNAYTVDRIDTHRFVSLFNPNLLSDFISDLSGRSFWTGL